MSPLRLFAAFVASVALLLPWERCRSDCHDHVRPQVGPHACHAGDGECHDAAQCPGGHGGHDDPPDHDGDHAGPGDRHGHDARHSLFEFSTLRPEAPADLPALAALAAAAPGPPVLRTATAVSFVPEAFPLPPGARSTVLRL